MFIGHFAVGFGMKRLAPNTSFTLLLTAPLLLDLPDDASRDALRVRAVSLSADV